ncbi:Myb/SANT-like domain-containing protein [Plasmodiophora brassicae]
MVASDSVSANWKDGTKSKYLLRQLQKQADRGKRAGNNFKKEAWTAALANFNTKFGVQYSLSQVKTHFESLKTKFGHFRSLLDMSGFGWDDNLKVATAPDDVWEKLLAVVIVQPLR